MPRRTMRVHTPSSLLGRTELAAWLLFARSTAARQQVARKLTAGGVHEGGRGVAVADVPRVVSGGDGDVAVAELLGDVAQRNSRGEQGSSASIEPVRHQWRRQGACFLASTTRGTQGLGRD